MFFLEIVLGFYLVISLIATGNFYFQATRLRRDSGLKGNGSILFALYWGFVMNWISLFLRR